MNRDNIRRLAKHLKRLPPEYFSMNSYVDARKRDEETTDQTRLDKLIKTRRFKCGTSACIAGHAVFLLDPDNVERVAYFGDWSCRARDLLGLGEQEAEDLFYDFKIKTPKEAARRLKGFLE